MLQKFDELEAKFERLTAQLSDPEIIGDSARFTKTAKERAGLEPVVEAYREFKRLEAEVKGNEELLAEKDEEIRQMAKDELARLRPLRDAQDAKLKILLLPKDPNDDKDILVEIRGGAGGEESNLFAADLLRMYTRYAGIRGWRTELMNLNETELGGVKEAVLSIKGEGV